LVGFNQPAQETTLTEQMAMADNFIQVARAHAHGQWSGEERNSGLRWLGFE
jgi:hypothetical protein